MNNEIQLSITGLVYNQTVVGTYGLVMSEMSGNRRFSVMIGEPEAQSIAMKLNNKKAPRPLTHDLINSILRVFDSTLEKILIYNMVSDIFYSELHIRKGEELLIVDARTSDAVALAVRCEAPIFIKSEILDVVGTAIEPSEETALDDPDDELSVQAEDLTPQELDQLNMTDLEELLKMALQEEKYELAVTIRDAITRKNKH